MKTFDSAVRFSATVILTLALLLSGFSVSANARPFSKTRAVFTNFEKHVHIEVEIHGEIEDHTVESVEELIADWLEEAKIVVEETEGAKFLNLHVVLTVTDDKHFAIHEDCGNWKEDKEAATLDAIDEILHQMTLHFIEKFNQ